MHACPQTHMKGIHLLNQSSVQRGNGNGSLLLKSQLASAFWKDQMDALTKSMPPGEKNKTRDERGQGEISQGSANRYLCQLLCFICSCLDEGQSFLSFVLQRSGISACCDLCFPPPPAHSAHVYLRPHSHEGVLKLQPDSIEEPVKTAKAYWPNGGTLRLLQSGAGHQRKVNLLKWISIFIFYYSLLASPRTYFGISAFISDDAVLS